MTNKQVKAGIDRINSNMSFYQIIQVEDAVGENGKADNNGYAVINTETGVTEHSSTLLPGVIFQAQHLDDMLRSLLTRNNESEGEAVELSAVVDEDPVMN